jgi:4-amino-4-deoxy-L-arabinose transferase-like glycosyltransferase
MPIKNIWSVIAFILIFLMLFGNKKVRIFSVFIKQVQVFKNAKTAKFSPWDFACFLFMPIALAAVITFGFKAVIDDNLAGVLTTVFALVFTVLFGFAAILIGKIDSKNAIEKQVVGETFISIVSATLLSLLSAVLSIIITKINCTSILSILSLIVYAVSFMTIMLLLLITKRTFIVYCDSMDKKD